MSTNGEFGCFYLIAFADGSVEGQVLHRGSLEECQSVYESTPAIAYSGKKTVRKSSMHVWDWPAVSELFSEAA